MKQDLVVSLAHFFLTIPFPSIFPFHSISSTGLRRAEHVPKIAPKKERILNHIQCFTCRASHYARRGGPGRKFLPSDLSVARMHRMFIEQKHEQVSYSLYWSICCHDFNLAFGHPAKDRCSTCIESRIAIKDPDLSDEEKRDKIQLYAHHRCAPMTH